MKGAVSTLVVVVGLIIILWIAVTLVTSGGSIAERLNFDNLVLPEISLPTETVVLGDLQEVNVVGNRVVGGVSLPMTSTEVACKIGKVIQGDFIPNGDAKSHGGKKLGDFAKNTEIIDVEPFTIKWTYDDSASAAVLDSYGTLTEDQKELLKTSCIDPGVAPLDASLFGCKSGFIDEECISKQFNALMVGINKLCTGDKPLAFGSPQVPLTFGNDKCTAYDGIDKGADDCNVICPGGNRIYSMEAASGDGKNIYEVGSDNLKADSFPPNETEKYVYSGTLKDAINGGLFDQTYAYALYWNSDKLGYSVDIGKIPTEKLSDNVDVASFPSQLATLFKDGDRDIYAGYYYSPFRTKAAYTLKFNNEMNLADFVNDFTNSIGDGWRWRKEPCLAEDCLKTQVQDYRIRYAGMGTTGVIGWDEERDCSTNLQKIQPNFHTVHIYTNLDINTDKLNTKDEYVVVLNKWKQTAEGGWHTPICKYLAAICVYCVKSCSDTGERNSRDCLLDASYGNQKSDIVYVDYSLIIIDKEQAGMMDVLGSNTDQGTQGQGGTGQGSSGQGEGPSQGAGTG